MPSHYDNWEKLVEAVLRRVHDRELALLDSCSDSSASSSSLSNLSLNEERPTCELLMDYSDIILDYHMWKTMLPTGKDQLVWSSSAPLNFSLDAGTGKNCFLLGATKSYTTSKYLKRMVFYKDSRDCRFSEAPLLVYPGKLDLQCRVNTKILWPDTRYVAYLVYSSGYIREGLYTLKDDSIWNYIGNSEIGDHRADEWRQIQLGDFKVHQTDQDLTIHLQEHSRPANKNIVIQGIEFRPHTKNTRKIETPRNTNTGHTSLVLTAVLSYGTGKQLKLIEQQNIQIPIGIAEQTMNHMDWKFMIPPHQRQAIWRSDFLSFFLDQKTTKNCFLIGSTNLVFSPANWEIARWPPPRLRSRFREIVRLINPGQYRMEGEINAEMLSPETHYSAYLVFGLIKDKVSPVQSEIVSGDDLVQGTVCFERGKRRADTWTEVELGHFYVGKEVQGAVKMAMWGTGTNTPDPYIGGLYIEGIEFRPSILQTRVP